MRTSVLALFLLCFLFFFGNHIPEPVRELLPAEVSAYLPSLQNAGIDNFSPALPTDAADSESLLPGGTLTVDFLDVGQGLSILVNADGHYLLYDGGDRTASSFVVAYLKKQGVEQLDYLIASHYDADHLNGLVGALNVFPTKCILAPDYTADTKIYRSFCQKAAETGTPIEHPSPGEVHALGDAQFTVLAPASASYSDENDYSIAIRLTYGDRSFLFTGDAGVESEAEMTAGGLTLRSDVLCPGHHGSSTASSSSFLEAVRPAFTVISSGAGNSYGHPHREALERLKKSGTSLFRTDLQGTVRAVTDGSALTWSAEPCDDFTPGGT